MSELYQQTAEVTHAHAVNATKKFSKYVISLLTVCFVLALKPETISVFHSSGWRYPIALLLLSMIVDFARTIFPVVTQKSPKGGVNPYLPKYFRPIYHSFFWVQFVLLGAAATSIYIIVFLL